MYLNFLLIYFFHYFFESFFAVVCYVFIKSILFWYEIFEAVSELSLFPMNQDKPTSKFVWFFVFSVIKSSVFNMMWVGVLFWESINLLSASDFFWQINQYFLLLSFRSEVCSFSLSKFSNAIKSSWRNPLIGFFSLIFE